MNTVHLVGRLGADPESRTTNGGSTVATLRVATSERVKDASGEWTEHTEWHRVVAFGKTAENAARFLAKGREVAIEGKLRTNKWQDKEGKDRYTTEIIAHRVHFIGSKSEQRQPSGYSGGNGYASSAPSDDIPF